MEEKRYLELKEIRRKIGKDTRQLVRFMMTQDGLDFAEETRKRRIANIVSELKQKGISSTVEQKDSWGEIVVFEIKGKKVFANGYKNGKIEAWYYSNEFSCNRCMIRF